MMGSWLVPSFSASAICVRSRLDRYVTIITSCTLSLNSRSKSGLLKCGTRDSVSAR